MGHEVVYNLPYLQQQGPLRRVQLGDPGLGLDEKLLRVLNVLRADEVTRDQRREIRRHALPPAATRRLHAARDPHPTGRLRCPPRGAASARGAATLPPLTARRIAFAHAARHRYPRPYPRTVPPRRQGSRRGSPRAPPARPRAAAPRPAPHSPPHPHRAAPASPSSAASSRWNLPERHAERPRRGPANPSAPGAARAREGTRSSEPLRARRAADPPPRGATAAPSPARAPHSRGSPGLPEAPLGAPRAARPPAPPMRAAPGEARGHPGGSRRCAPSPSAMAVPRGAAAAQGPEGLPLPDKPRAETAPPPQ